jgi:hypothetical protein
MWVSKYGQTQIQEVKLQQKLQLPKFPKNWSEILLLKMFHGWSSQNYELTIYSKVQSSNKS